MEDQTKRFQAEDGKHLKWSVSKLQAVKREPYSPPLATTTPSVQFSLGDIELQGYTGNMGTWDNFGRFMYELNKGRAELPSELQEQLSELLQGVTYRREKIALIYRYLQENTRYVSIQLGIGGWQTFPAEYVYENGYGDCKALSNYMKGMLEFAGISSHLAIICAGSDPKPVDPQFPTNSFNHMILCVPLAEDTVWLECTSDNLTAGYLGDFTADRYALLATPSGGKLVRTPKREPHENTRNRIARVQIGEDGHAQVQSKQSYTGYLQDDYAALIVGRSAREREKYIRNTIAAGSFDLLDYELYRDSLSAEPMCHTSYELAVRNCASISGKRLFLKPNLLSVSLPIPEKVDTRKQPVRLEAPYLLKDSVHYMLPKGYVIESLPEMPMEIETAFGSYKAEIKILGEGEFIYKREMLLKPVDAPAKEYEAFRDFFREASKADKVQIILSNRS